MCGIAGVIVRRGATPNLEQLDRLERALVHRGPDDAGRYVRDNVGFIHRRLSIIDLTTGHQPLFSQSGLALVANGEIYNYIELRAQKLADVAFATHSDCETILHLYEKAGIDGLDDLRGMYALALHDPKSESVLLARDPFGIKPLYYVEGPDYFAFASEAQALLEAGLAPRGVETSSVEELLQLGLTTGRSTAFSPIRRLLPGEALVVRDGRICERRTHAALPAGGPERISEADALVRLDGALMDSVNIHQRCDTPFGLFLSGGIDSRSILACMTKLSAGKVKAYTAAFPNAVDVPDESDSASRAAKIFGAEHIKVVVSEQDFWTNLPAVVSHLDDPVADPAALPTFMLARAAAKDVKVVLCGEGGDELLGGYSRYLRQARPVWLGGRVRRRTGPFSKVDVLRREPLAWRDGMAAAEREAQSEGRNRLQAAQALDCADYLSHNLLTKTDRCLMAHGLEGRTPLLDPAIAAAGFRLPNGLKLRHGRGKYLLRKWLAEQAPQDDCFARKKGFKPPYLGWTRARGETLGPLVAADPAVQAMCKPGLVEALFTSDDRSVLEAGWRLLFYALWHRRHVRGLRLEGDVFECLSLT